VDTTPDAEAVLLGRERMARFGQCVGRLNDKTRDIFVSHRIDGMTYQEIAQRHQLSVGADRNLSHGSDRTLSQGL
jgi:RNA polymerase sigma-70 factor (ECF subfamily)